MRALGTALLFFVLALGACAPAPQPAAEPALWRISDEDSEIWLYGTVHVLPPDIRWRGPRVSAAFARAEEFVTETDTSAEAAAGFPALAARYGALPEGERLSDRLSDDDRERLARLTAAYGFSPEAIEALRPWLAALQLSYAAAARQGHSSDLGVENVLAAEARRTGKRLSFFETPEAQIRVLAELPPEAELRFLTTTLRQVEEDTVVLDQLDAAWARGDVEELERLLDADWRESGPIIHERLIFARNRAWADAITERLNGEGRIFIAVGAAHLVGEESVVDLLRARGISVEGP
jgi:uncharacterized protein YbaP (TraB family)